MGRDISLSSRFPVLLLFPWCRLEGTAIIQSIKSIFTEREEMRWNNYLSPYCIYLFC
jgi:hypothetical protein